MGAWLESTKRVIQEGRFVKVTGDEVELTEESATSTCGPIRLGFSGDLCAVRLLSTDHHPVLSERDSVRKIPDYLVFCQEEEEPIGVLVCEMKSSETGAASALPQVQLGVLLSRYLLRLAWLMLSKEHPMPEVNVVGTIVFPKAPLAVKALPRTRARTTPASAYYAVPCDRSGAMLVYQLPDNWSYRMEELLLRT